LNEKIFLTTSHSNPVRVPNVNYENSVNSVKKRILSKKGICQKGILSYTFFAGLFKKSCIFAENFLYKNKKYRQELHNGDRQKDYEYGKR
jgi:hypothetical protein